MNTLHYILGGMAFTLALLSAVLWYQKRRVCQQNRSLQTLALVAQRIDNAVWITDLDGDIEWVNEAFSRITGFALGEVEGKNPGPTLLGPLHNTRTVQRLRDGMIAGKPFSVELLCYHKTGYRFWLHLDVTPIWNEQGQLTHHIAIGSDITERKRAEEETTLLNRRNELFLNAVGEGMLGVDMQGFVTFFNPAAARLTGWQAGEVVGNHASMLLYQLQVDRIRNGQDDAFAATAFQEGKVFLGDSDCFRRQDGTFFPVELTSTPVREGDNIFGTIVVFHDVTERRQNEALRLRESRQSALRADISHNLATVDSMPNILQRCAQALLTHFHGALARVWTVSVEEEVLELQVTSGSASLPITDHSRVPFGTGSIGMIAREQIPHMTNDILLDPMVEDVDWVRREAICAFVGFPLFVENRLVGVLALYSREPFPVDILECLGAVADSIAQGVVRKQAEEKIVEQAALLDKAQDAILVTDLSSRVIYWNKSAERLYGWPAKDTYGKFADELIFRDHSYFQRVKKEVLEKGEWKGESCQVTKGDETVVVESTWTLVNDNAGRPRSILVVNTDVSEKKKIEAQFLRTQRMESIGTLAGGIAHDLNNVLAPIMMSVEILKEKFKDPQSQRMLTVLESSAKRGADMVKQVLTFARGVDGERVLLQTRHLIKEVAKIVSETFPKTIQLKTNLAESLWPIMGDATHLHQVLVNLAVNARDALPQGGTISISAENTILEGDESKLENGAKPGFYVVMKVSDNGTGIPRDILDKIFEPFFTTKEMGKGTGLGLATVLGIVKSHGGFVQVQTEVGKGTTFLIYLPAVEGVQNLAGDSENQKMPLGSGELILAVDDEASVLTMTKETLEAFGYKVVTAQDGTEAVAAYTANRGNIKGVLTDMLMPFMDGPSTIRVLRKIDPDVRIIAASGLMDGEKVRDATGMENITFLMKPYTAGKLLSAMHKLLNTSV
jgi:PAS domain S-box-containing protein